MRSVRLAVKVLAITVITAVIAATAAYTTFFRADIAFATLESRYGDDRSHFAYFGDGVVVHYRDEGPRDAAAIILIHGFASSLQTWDQWASSLSTTHRIITLDLPGHGFTQASRDYAPTYEGYADVVERLMRELHLERAVVGGSSLGGAVAWTLAVRHPERVQGLVLVGAVGWPEMPTAPSPLSPSVFRALGKPVIGDLVRGLDPSGPMRTMLLGCYADPALVDTAMVTRYVDLARAPNHRPVLTKVLLTFGAPATAETLAHIAAPTLILHGAEDALVPVRAAARFDEAIPNSEVIIYPGAGHFVHEERAEQTAEDLSGWLSRTFATP